MMDWIVCSNLWNCYSIHARICVKKISALLQKQRFFTRILSPEILLYHFIDPVMLVYIIPELLHRAHLGTGFSSFPCICNDGSADSQYLRFSQEVYGSPAHPAQCLHQIPPPPCLPSAPSSSTSKAVSGESPSFSKSSRITKYSPLAGVKVTCGYCPSSSMVTEFRSAQSMVLRHYSHQFFF